MYLFSRLWFKPHRNLSKILLSCASYIFTYRKHSYYTILTYFLGVFAGCKNHKGLTFWLWVCPRPQDCVHLRGHGKTQAQNHLVQGWKRIVWPSLSSCKYSTDRHYYRIYLQTLFFPLKKMLSKCKALTIKIKLGTWYHQQL